MNDKMNEKLYTYLEYVGEISLTRNEVLSVPTHGALDYFLLGLYQKENIKTQFETMNLDDMVKSIMEWGLDYEESYWRQNRTELSLWILWDAVEKIRHGDFYNEEGEEEDF